MHVSTYCNDLCIPTLRADGVVVRIMSFNDDSEPGRAIKINNMTGTDIPAAPAWSAPAISHHMLDLFKAGVLVCLLPLCNMIN